MFIRSIVCLLITAFYGLAMYITSYKLPLSLQRPYHIFPWEEDAHISASNPVLLSSHIFLSLVLLTMAWLRVVGDTFLPHYYNRLRKPIRDNVNYIWMVIHMTFCLAVLLNCWNLGGIPWWQAIIANVSALILLTYFRRFPIVYFLILSIPVLLESYLLISQYFECMSANFLHLFNPIFRNSMMGCPLIPRVH